MKLTVLSDNRSCDSCLSTEHGLSILLTTERYKILLDTGASDVFFRNAELLGEDFSDVDYVFISHGHCDHAGGLRYFLEHNQKAQIIVSPDAMSGKYFSKRNLDCYLTVIDELLKYQKSPIIHKFSRYTLSKVFYTGHIIPFKDKFSVYWRALKSGYLKYIGLKSSLVFWLK